YLARKTTADQLINKDVLGRADTFGGQLMHRLLLLDRFDGYFSLKACTEFSPFFFHFSTAKLNI
ncbi:hypothetical protein, partial [Parapedobacter luteus]|uniref:hypothetical protein n=1 Tax=Parapedobacter luteus TaxID=623280 RepID=UPI001C37D660